MEANWDRRSNRTFQQVHISDRFLRGVRNAPEAPVFSIEQSPTVIALGACNLAFRIDIRDEEKMRRSILHQVADSGIGIDVSYVDFASLLNVLQSLRNVGSQYTESSLPPLSEYLHKMLTVNCSRYFLPDKSLPMKGSIKYMTEIVQPLGVTNINCDSMLYTANMHRFHTTVLTRGTCTGNTALGEESIPLRLPYDKIAGTRNISSLYNYGLCAKLYLVVGPDDELLCGEHGDMVVDKPVASTSTYTTRNVDGHQVVDQSYTASFVFAKSGGDCKGCS